MYILISKRMERTSITKYVVQTTVDDHVTVSDQSLVDPPSGATLADGSYTDITVSGTGTVMNLNADTVGLTELSATGTPDGTTYLRGDNTWAVPSATVADGSITTTKLGGDITTAGKALLDDADNTAQRTTLGLGTAATMAATAFASASHTHTSSDLTITSSQAKLGGDITITTANTWYGTTAVTLDAGTWLINAHITVARTATTALTYTARIYNGSTAEASTAQYMPSVANHSATLALTCIVTPAGSTTYTIQATANQGTSGVIKAAALVNAQGNNATVITAIRLA